jgi:hypothetical protein
LNATDDGPMINTPALKDRWRGRVNCLRTHKRYLFGKLRGKPVAHLIHVGKTGGTALRQALLPYVDTGRYTIFLHGHSMTLPRLRPGEKAFFFQREPVSKFLSAFYYRQRQAQPYRHIPWRADEALAFAQFHSANDLANALSSADGVLRAKAVHAMRSIHHVRDSVVRWLADETYFLSRLDDILFIGFQEQLGQDFEALKRILHLPDTIRLPTEASGVYQKTPARLKYLDATAEANLRTWYARDVEFYELCLRIRCQRRLGSA